MTKVANIGFYDIIKATTLESNKSLKRFSTGYSAAERAALFHDTAVRAYRISNV